MANNFTGQLQLTNQYHQNARSYQRPTDWLPLPEISSSEEKFAGLFPIYEGDDNYIALQFEGNYVVDWGDGTVENITGGTKAQHSYDYANISNSTITTRDFKQVLVTVVPGDGNNLTGVNLLVRHDDILPDLMDKPAPWLDISLSLPNAAAGASIVFTDGSKVCNRLQKCSIINSGYASDLSYLFQYSTSLQQCIFGVVDYVETLDYIFSSCGSLPESHLPVFPAVTSVYRIFENCYSLKSVVVSGLPIVTDLSDFCYNNGSLVRVEIYGVPSVQFYTSSFENCYSLRYVYIETMLAVTNAEYMFYDCYALEKISLPPTPSLEIANEMFWQCRSLEEVNLKNLDSLVEAAFMFYRCYSLTDASLPGTPSLQYAVGLFQACSSLKKVYLHNLDSLTDATNMLSGCYSLIDLQLPEMPLVEHLDSTFSDYLPIPEINLTIGNYTSADATFRTSQVFKITISGSSYLTSLGNPFIGESFEGCGNLSFLSMPGVNVSFSVNSCPLSKSALLSLFADLAVVSVYTTIDISNCPGTSELSPSEIAIATDKGWTVII
jgi:hypothetical protein